MEVKKEYIEALQWLFGGECRVGEIRGVEQIKHPDYRVPFRCGDKLDEASVCHLIDEALLKREDVYAVNVRRDKSEACYIKLYASEGSWKWQSINADFDDPLTARLEAIKKLKENQ